VRHPAGIPANVSPSESIGFETHSSAITLALLLADEELDSLEKRRSSWRNRGVDDQVNQGSQALNRLRVMVSLPKYSPPMPRPPTGDRGWMA
jgi:hypothetical protein